VRTIDFQSTETATEQNYMEWADKDQTRCPVCRSDMITAGPSETISEALMISPIKCEDCESTWVENYKLTGYDDITYKKENENE
jgi:predicted Zn-ribbon and HTH transcriptional regulator